MNKPILPFTKYWLWLAAFLDLVIGFELFILAEQTARYFAWPINPPITAAFLGVSYWAGCVLVVVSSRERTWEHARVAIPGVLVFAILTLAATLLHFDKFSFSSEFAWYTRSNAWIWLLVYIIAPLIMLIALFKQARTRASLPATSFRQPLWFRLLLAAIALSLTTSGILLFFLPTTGIQVWIWQLSVLTARSVGAWLVGIGLVTAHMTHENDWLRNRAGLLALASFAILQIIVLLRFPDQIYWNNILSLVFIIFLGLSAIVGIYGFYQATRRKQRQAQKNPLLRR